MTEEQLNEIEARANAATPGRWHVDGDGEHGFGNVSSEEWGPTWKSLFATTEDGAFRPEDGEFIAHIRADVPALIAEVRHLRAELALAGGYAANAERDRATCAEFRHVDLADAAMGVGEQGK